MQNPMSMQCVSVVGLGASRVVFYQESNIASCSFANLANLVVKVVLPNSHAPGASQLHLLNFATVDLQAAAECVEDCSCWRIETLLRRMKRCLSPNSRPDLV